MTDTFTAPSQPRRLSWAVAEIVAIQEETPRVKTLSLAVAGRRIDAAMLTEIGIPAIEEANVFVCGPTGMVEGAAQPLIDLGMGAGRIRTERFGPSGG